LDILKKEKDALKENSNVDFENKHGMIIVGKLQSKAE
jgi:hypothetical protein